MFLSFFSFLLIFLFTFQTFGTSMNLELSTGYTSIQSKIEKTSYTSIALYHLGIDFPIWKNWVVHPGFSLSFPELLIGDPTYGFNFDLFHPLFYSHYFSQTNPEILFLGFGLHQRTHVQSNKEFKGHAFTLGFQHKIDSSTSKLRYQLKLIQLNPQTSEINITIGLLF